MKSNICAECDLKEEFWLSGPSKGGAFSFPKLNEPTRPSKKEIFTSGNCWGKSGYFWSPWKPPKSPHLLLPWWGGPPYSLTPFSPKMRWSLSLPACISLPVHRVYALHIGPNLVPSSPSILSPRPIFHQSGSFKWVNFSSKPNFSMAYQPSHSSDLYLKVLNLIFGG